MAKMNKREQALIDRIVNRALDMYNELGEPRERISVLMDIVTCHEICPLDLAAMATGREEDFAHDIGGINFHLDRKAKVMRYCFVPRFKKRSVPA